MWSAVLLIMGSGDISYREEFVLILGKMMSLFICMFLFIFRLEDRIKGLISFFRSSSDDPATA